MTSAATLQVRINHIDHLSSPTRVLDKSPFPHSPILRIFGSTPDGDNACVHIHQVYPYFFVEYSGGTSPKEVHKYIARLTKSLNYAMALALKRSPNAPNAQFIRSILLVKGHHFYGFHTGYSLFLKILVIDPSQVTKVVKIMQSGSVMQTRFQTFESHISYILQFMSDFNLYGCGWLDLASFHLRRTPGAAPFDPKSSNLSKTAQALVHTALESPHNPTTRLVLEVDVTAPDILNRHSIDARVMHHKLQIPAPILSSEPLIPSVKELWDDERDRRARNGLSPSPEIPVGPSERSRGAGSGWAAEARWWDEIRARIQREGEQEQSPINVVHDWERWIMTTFESVEALWESKYKRWKPTDKAAVEEKEPFMSNPYENVGDTSFSGDADMEQGQEEEEDLDASIFDDMAGADMEETEWAKMMAEEDKPLLVENEQEEDPEPFLNGNADPFLTPQKYSHVSPQNLNLLDPQTPRADTSIKPLKQSSASARERTPPSPTTDKNTQSATRDVRQRDISPRPVKIRKLTHTHTDITSSIPRSQNVPQPSNPSSIPRSQNVPQPSNPSTSSLRPAKKSYTYAIPPPTTAELLRSCKEYGLQEKVYREPYYSLDKDVPSKAKEYAGLRYVIKGGQGLRGLDEWESDGGKKAKPKPPPWKPPASSFGLCGWEYASTPPSKRSTEEWLKANSRKSVAAALPSSQIAGPTQDNPYGLKSTPQDPRNNTRQRQNMSLLSLEIFVPTRPDFVPDSEIDEIVAVFYKFQDGELDEDSISGIIVVDNTQLNSRKLREFKLDVVDGELDLINRVIDVIAELDPDILVGWDVQTGSWGYLYERGQVYGFDFEDLVSRAPAGRQNDQTAWTQRHGSSLRVVGRHVLNIWRIMRVEQTLSIYTFENTAFHILGRRFPRYSFATLTKWYESPSPAHVAALIRYFINRTSVNLDILEATEIVTKTCEFARVFGVEFYSVLTRGSQFKVEAFMFRIAKPESFLLISPSKEEVGRQNAAECMPLVMEPMSAFYNGPVVVLDFESLYPSIMIAYNYCYSTCLGRVREFEGRPKFGVTELEHPPGLLETLKDHIHVAANGIMYVKSNVRRGLLGRMLTELLKTRVMVKQAMKGVKEDKALKRALNARQLGLKFIANVTYGYTSATFSGRMPAVEIADSIVQSGRETLEKAIRLINSTVKWRAKVVYGDTDSVFVHLPGRTKDEAFLIGYAMAETITAMNPAPIKLKFEKVYLPCVLMAKKRYVGFKYENPDDLEPTFDAKGIETVRRDGVPAQRKMTETCLKILFRTQDLSEVKAYCWESWRKLLEEKASLQDFIFAKEVRMGTYSEKGPPPPGVVVAARRMLLDKKDEAAYGDRIPYVVVRGLPNSRLVDRSFSPLDVLEDSRKYKLDSAYYISRVLIPPLERIFNLLGADVKSWFDDMPKTIRAEQPESLSPNKLGARSHEAVAINKLNIDHHFRNTSCLVCARPASDGICEECRLDPQTTITVLSRRIQTEERRLTDVHRLCASCTGLPQTEAVKCISLDCSWLFERVKTSNRVEFMGEVRDKMLEFQEEHVALNKITHS